MLVHVPWGLLRSRLRSVDLCLLDSLEHLRTLKDVGLSADERLQVVEDGVALMLAAKLLIQLPEIVVEVGKTILQNPRQKFPLIELARSADLFRRVFNEEHVGEKLHVRLQVVIPTRWPLAIFWRRGTAASLFRP